MKREGDQPVEPSLEDEYGISMSEPDPEDNKRIRAYLLNNLSEEERSQFEERLMTEKSDELFRQLLGVEDELIDDYAHASISEPDRKRFESHFLSSPERRQKLSFSRALDLYIRRHRSPWWSSFLSFFSLSNPTLRPALAAAALLLAAIVAWPVFDAWRKGQSSEEIRVEEKRPAATETPGAAVSQPSPQDNVATDRTPEPTPPPANRPQPPPLERKAGPVAPRIAATVFSGGVRSGGQTNRITPRPNEKAVRVRIILKEDRYPSYRAEITTVDSRDALPPQDGLKAVGKGSRRAVFLRVPFAQYSAGDYDVTLKGRTPEGELEDVGSYSFRVLPAN